MKTAPPASAAPASPAPPRASVRYRRLFEPTNLGSMELKNRFAMAPMGPLGFSDAEGGWNSRGIEYYVARARGGVGLIITGITPVTNPAEKFPNGSVPMPMRNPGAFLRTSRELVERVHAYDAKIMLQLGAGFGRVIMTAFLQGGAQPVAPSPIKHRWSEAICREMTVEEIHATVRSMGDSAVLAQRAGFDGVQIHAVHEGYLLDQFATSFYNQRTDAYGGSLDNRLRFAREIVDEIKERCGADYPVTLRFSPKSFVKDWREGGLPGEDFVEKGRDLPEGLEAARLFEEYGYDALDIDVGTYDSWFWNHPPMYQKKGLYVPFAKAVSDAVGITVICAGRMDDPDIALAAVEDGATDLVSLGRPLLADADYVNKLHSGHQNLIRPCLSCQEGCMGRIEAFAAINCAVNPQCGREAEWRLHPALRAKNVMIVGGGVAGCEAARVLALRGHVPVIYEASAALGGNLIPGGVPDFKEDDLALIRWYEATLAELGVEVHLNAPVDETMIEASAADEIIVATGSVPRLFALPGGVPVFSAADVLEGVSVPGATTVIVGGGLVGCELALHLADHGVNVTIVEQAEDILDVSGPLCEANHMMLHELIPFKGIATVTSATVLRATPQGVVVVVGGIEREIASESVILSVGYASNNTLYRSILDSGKEIHLLGDARRVSNIMYGIWDAFEVASGL
ncbi:FAD-dependent oxidoreductase [Cryobacterium sp. 10S3]|uniref:oxidoreductase n=1 Tax=Cryobacterium sp. 10S3 TaxID=3048582 RepID=UPI003A0FE7B4